jgi:hypothetical protein
MAWLWPRSNNAREEIPITNTSGSFITQIVRYESGEMKNAKYDPVVRFARCVIAHGAGIGCD